MDVKSEVKAREDAEAGEAKFREKHNVPVEEWELALAMADAYCEDLRKYFWKLWVSEL